MLLESKPRSDIHVDKKVVSMDRGFGSMTTPFFQNASFTMGTASQMQSSVFVQSGAMRTQAAFSADPERDGFPTSKEGGGKLTLHVCFLVTDSM